MYCILICGLGIFMEESHFTQSLRQRDVCFCLCCCARQEFLISRVHLCSCGHSVLRAAWYFLVFIRDGASCTTVQMVYVSCQLSDGAPLCWPGENMCLLMGDITTHRRIWQHSVLLKVRILLIYVFKGTAAHVFIFSSGWRSRRGWNEREF